MSGFADLISYICNFALHNSQYFVWFQVNLQKRNSITWLTYLMSFHFWFLHWQLKADEDKAVFHNNCILNSSASEHVKWRFGGDSVTFWVLWYLRVIIDYCYNFTLLEYWNCFKGIEVANGGRGDLQLSFHWESVSTTIPTHQ